MSSSAHKRGDTATKKAIIATAIAAATTIGFSATASADGHQPTRHPGHVGFIKTGGTGGGVPANHYHNEDCFPDCYPDGPGGWGGAVSGAAQGGGIPGAHG